MAMAQTQNKPVVNPALAYVAVIAGWLVPGLGHLILNRWKKALVYFLAVGSLAIAGMMMRGNVFSLDTSDPPTILEPHLNGCTSQCPSLHSRLRQLHFYKRWLFCLLHARA